MGYEFLYAIKSGSFDIFVCMCLYRERAVFEATTQYHTAKHKIQKLQLQKAVIAYAVQEILWFSKFCMKQYLSKKKLLIKSLKLDKDHVISDEMILLAQSPLLVKYEPDSNKKLNVQDLWNNFFKQLWPTTYTNLLHSVIYKCLLNMKDSLDSTWQEALRSGNWVPLWESATGLTSPYPRWQWKLLLPQYIVNSLKSLLYCVGSLIKYDELVKKLNSQGTLWNLATMILITITTYNVNDTWFPHWQQPRKGIDWRFYTFDIGLETVSNSWFLLSGLMNRAMFNDGDTMTNTVINPKYLGIQSRFKTFQVPATLDFDELHQFVFNMVNDSSHWTFKFVQLCCVINTVLVEKHGSFLKTILNKGKFLNGASFGSDAMQGNNARDTVGFVWRHYIHVDIPSKIYRDIQCTFANLKHTDINLKSNPKCIGITDISQNYLQTSLVKYFS